MQKLSILTKKLTLETVKSTAEEVRVRRARFGIYGTSTKFRVNCALYECEGEDGVLRLVNESFTPSSEKSMYVFYGQFVRKHLEHSYIWFNYLNDRKKVEEMLDEALVPSRLLIAPDEYGIVLRKKFFD